MKHKKYIQENTIMTLSNTKLYLMNTSKFITVFAVTVVTFFSTISSTLAESSGQIRGQGNRCIDVAGGEVEDVNGNPSHLQLFPCHKATDYRGRNQQWKFLSDGTIRGQGNRCIDVAGGEVKDANGNPARLILFPCTGGANQKWRFLSDGTIRGLGNMCIDVAGGEVEDVKGNPSSLILFPCTGNANQKWR
jgi:endo-1,4-beta-xylanase